jgi:hypothetical protein
LEYSRSYADAAAYVTWDFIKSILLHESPFGIPFESRSYENSSIGKGKEKNPKGPWSGCAAQSGTPFKYLLNGSYKRSLYFGTFTTKLFRERVLMKVEQNINPSIAKHLYNGFHYPLIILLIKNETQKGYKLTRYVSLYCPLMGSTPAHITPSLTAVTPWDARISTSSYIEKDNYNKQITLFGALKVGCAWLKDHLGNAEREVSGW